MYTSINDDEAVNKYEEKSQSQEPIYEQFLVFYVS